MKKIILALILSLSLMGSSLALAQKPNPKPVAPSQEAVAEPRPKMVLLETEYDAKLNPPGSSVSHQFVVRNEGDDNLQLEVVPGCGCTVTNYDRVITPGSTGTITVTVDLYDAWAGRFVNKAVTVSSNDPKIPVTRLIMRAQVAPKKTEGSAPEAKDPEPKDSESKTTEAQ
ncbi:MAG: DUF1573 domain-containing protein [Deltaproteobacteria bacterium]|jgi:hypothetical protein|nr:DUF1573 domain-containing protein [Deltaproteobacteria bacterium]